MCLMLLLWNIYWHLNIFKSFNFHLFNGILYFKFFANFN